MAFMRALTSASGGGGNADWIPAASYPTKGISYEWDYIAGEASFYVYAYGEDVSQTPTLLVDGAIVQNITIPSGIVWLAISRRAYSAVDRVVTFS